MQNRCNESDNFKADIHMPIHTNACNSKITGGTRIFVLNSARKNAGQAVLNALGPISPGTADSLTYKTDLYEINVPNALTIYVEVEFHDTKTGSDWIRNNITNIGETICKGLCSYFGVTYKVPANKKVLDSSGYKKGDNTSGSLALKELLLIAKKLKIHNQGMDENGIVGDGTVAAINTMLKKWGYEPTGVAGNNFIKKLTSEICKKI